jgi:NAD(P)-dependent dehydrogenase (short-subunit alcohol dehydrogenase family)
MKGRTALVTGGSRGIGRAVVARFEELGAQVIAPARAELDLRDAEAVEAFAASLEHTPDILVNDAGVNPLAWFGDIADEAMDEVLAVNLLAPFRLCRALAPRMARNGYGRIVNVSSVWSLVAKQRRGAYAISKAGLNGLTRSLAVECAAAGVLVNAVAPGFIATELTVQNNSPEEIAAVVEGLPAARLGEPADVAELIAFLCSRRNGYCTGQVIACDGGYTCL